MSKGRRKGLKMATVTPVQGCGLKLALGGVIVLAKTITGAQLFMMARLLFIEAGKRLAKSKIL